MNITRAVILLALWSALFFSQVQIVISSLFKHTFNWHPRERETRDGTAGNVGQMFILWEFRKISSPVIQWSVFRCVENSNRKKKTIGFMMLIQHFEITLTEVFHLCECLKNAVLCECCLVMTYLWFLRDLNLAWQLKSERYFQYSELKTWQCCCVARSNFTITGVIPQPTSNTGFLLLYCSVLAGTCFLLSVCCRWQ